MKSATPKGKKIVILFDQFEEFFLTSRTPKSHEAFIKWLGETVADENMPVVFLIGIRADFFAHLQKFAPQIPEPTSIRMTYQLQNFDTEQAEQIFSAAGKADGIAFEPELIQAVIRELETEQFIRPAELQVVGTRLKRKNISTLNQYDLLGGARGILSSYINDEIKQSSNEQTARLVLRLMCADAAETKSPIDLGIDDILRGISSAAGTANQTPASSQEVVQSILKQFVAARILIHTDEDKYNLAHDYLALYVLTATEGMETNTERANLLLKGYIALYKEDPQTRIPLKNVRFIQKFASPEIIARDIVQELIRKSRRLF
jgi:conflict system STAND superfamily ATPase